MALIKYVVEKRNVGLNETPGVDLLLLLSLAIENSANQKLQKLVNFYMRLMHINNNVKLCKKLNVRVTPGVRKTYTVIPTEAVGQYCATLLLAT